jgi:Mg2+/Co2+ transporter CorB
LENISFGGQISILLLFLIFSAFFSISETSLMSLNRYRMRHLANEGHRGAKLASLLLSKTDKLLGVILLGNTLCIVGASALEVYISNALFGDEEYLLMAGSLVLTFAILVFSEISPKVIAAAHAEKIGFACSYLLYPLLWVFNPVVSFVNIFVRGFVRLLGIKVNFSETIQAITTEELRSIVTESGHYLPQKNRAILLNLFDLEKITVDDVMTAHTLIDSINLDDPIDETLQHISTSHHTRLPVRESAHEEIMGVIHVRKVINQLRSQRKDESYSTESLRDIISAPYFIPSGTPLYTQIQQFQEHQERLALVVNEYGELKGLVTLEDILEEMIGDFTTQSPSRAGHYRQEDDGSWLVDGSSALRDLNKKLNLNLPLDGPRTLNGLVIEHFEDIPEPNTSFKIGEHKLEIIQTQDRVVKSVKIFP